MAERNNNIVGIIILITMFLTAPIIGCGILLAKEPDNTCSVEILPWALIILGFSIQAVTLLAVLRDNWRLSSWPFIVYFVAMFIFILLLAAMVVLIYLVTDKGSGHPSPAPGRSYVEHDLNDFHGWLRRKVATPYKWNRIRSYLNSTHMCSELNQKYRTSQDFFNARLTAVQYGCCMPPAECGFTYINPTHWLITPNNSTGTAASKDCLLWSNDQLQLCFHCDSCKAGLLDNLTKQWRRIDLQLFITLVLLICFYFLGFCCAFRKSTTSDHEGPSPKVPPPDETSTKVVILVLPYS